MEVVDQDEILFADLNKQISLLIMDDDADQHLPYPPVDYQVYSRAVEPIAQPTQVFSYDQQSKGTGVFIPRSTHRRRKSKQGRLNTNYNAATSNNTREYSPNNLKDLILPHQPQLASKNYETYRSFNHKRI
ncbi:DNA polymerase epsilon subunit B like [Heracleum sosnowskyi]|uniref:DNA polymerase epsilon subunit B like n=1 Tax=Heracleum sosnowskyi TaxID=360622 RepID=A0AAD8I7B1_9APIA|nr:DNA polymerase epsilon subunit B like [Heracleum sosnowskyi]